MQCSKARYNETNYVTEQRYFDGCIFITNLSTQSKLRYPGVSEGLTDEITASFLLSLNRTTGSLEQALVIVSYRGITSLKVVMTSFRKFLIHYSLIAVPFGTIKTDTLS
jgi:hypothetical protein